MDEPKPDGGLSRRAFVAGAGALAGLPTLGLAAPSLPRRREARMKLTIRHVDADFEREPLVRPFGFKGGYLTELWQTAALMESDAGTRRVGLGTQSVLWSDADVFAGHAESGGNALMYALTERALQMVRGQSFETPVALLDAVLGEVLAYGRRITGKAELRTTFALNALVAVDNAAWLLYAADNGLEQFDAMIPEAYRPGLSYRHTGVVSIPTLAYSVPVEEMQATVDQGHFFLKLKLGQPGTQAEMLEQDKARLSAIHEAIGRRETPHTESGHLPYYFDLNGRYKAKDTLLRLLDHARAIGAFDRIALVEEPFPEALRVEVGDVGVPIIADESAHTDADALERIGLGYRAIALKAAAKTLSMTLKIAQRAHEHGVPCLVADLTVNPILVDWQKNVAARLPPFPGFRHGLLETNGHQNYARWAELERYHGMAGAPWTRARDGLFALDDDFYRHSGGIFAPSAHYDGLFRTTP